MEELLLTGELDELMELCADNGRAMVCTDDGKIFTFDMYEGTDRRMFATVEEAINWEKGYLK